MFDHQYLPMQKEKKKKSKQSNNSSYGMFAWTGKLKKGGNSTI